MHNVRKLAFENVMKARLKAYLDQKINIFFYIDGASFIQQELVLNSITVVFSI